MGLTYKENVADTRESPVREMVKELKEFGVDVHGYDPLLSRKEIEAFGVKALDFSFSTGFLFSKKKKCVYAYKFKGKRYDAGDKLGYIKAIIDFALEREDLKGEIGGYLREIVMASPQSFKVK